MRFECPSSTRRFASVSGPLVGAQAAIALCFALGVSCAHAPIVPRGPSRLDPAVSNHEIRQRLILVGDAGLLEGGRRTLAAIGELIASDPKLGQRTALVFLGDNIYPLGRELKANKPHAARVLNAQTHSGRGARQVIFIPGNHDWDDAARQAPFPEAVATLETMGRYLENSERTAAAKMLPRPGCAGPSIRQLDGLKLIVLDSEWWMQPETQRSVWAREQGCAGKSEREVLDLLAAELRCKDPSRCDPRVVVAHHPLETRGEHGGYFPWHEHLLCGGKLPLPVLCSLYVLARQHGLTHHDTSSKRYRHFVASIEGALWDAPPLVYAAGHEHTLQVLRGRFSDYQLVSGSGSKRGPVAASPGTLFAQGEHGFMLIDVLKSGRITLRVHSLGPASEPGVPAYGIDLRPAPGP